MKHIMLDIETLGRNPGCVVMSIAAVAFDPNTHSVADLTPPEGSTVPACSCTYESLTISLDIKNQLLNDGATIEPATLKWWQQQSSEAKDALNEGEIYTDMRAALDKLSYFINSVSNHYRDKVCIWSQGTDFDIAILRALYNQHFGPDSEPWLHTNLRDARTFIFTIGAMFSHSADPYALIPYVGGTHHSALDDARLSAYNVAYLAALLRESQQQQEPDSQ